MKARAYLTNAPHSEPESKATGPELKSESKPDAP